MRVNPDYGDLLPKPPPAAPAANGGYVYDPNVGFAVNAQGAVNPNDPAVIAALAQSVANNPGATMSGSYSGPDPTTVGPTPFTPPPALGTPHVSQSRGHTPGIDYKGYIDNDSIWRQQQADFSAQGIADAAQRRAANQRALIQWGEVPDMRATLSGLGLDPSSPIYQMLLGDVDEQTRNSAADLTAAGLSQSAQLGQQHTKAINDLMDQLAARGVVRSGATMAGSNLEAQRYDGAQFSGRQSLLDYLSGVQQAFAQSEKGRQSGLAQGLGDATTRQIAMHPYIDDYYVDPLDGTTDPAAPPPPVAQPASPAAPANAGAPQSTSFGGSNGPYIRPQEPAAPPAAPPPPPLPTQSPAYGAPQSVAFGGNVGPYIGTLPPSPTLTSTNQAVKNSLVKRLNLPQ